MLAWRRGNVTALRTRAEVVSTLFGDSLALLDVAAAAASARGAAWLDLGAGAGVPGIPLAVALPAAELTLLDSAVKKCAFLRGRAGGGRARRARRGGVRAQRASRGAGRPGREAYAVVLARAVAPLPALVELAAPLLAPGGVLLASKTGRALRDEGRRPPRPRRRSAASRPAPQLRSPRSPLGRRRVRRLPRRSRRTPQAAAAARGPGRQGDRCSATARRPGRGAPSASIGAPRKEPGDPRHRRDQPEGRGRQDHHRRQPRRLPGRGRFRRACSSTWTPRPTPRPGCRVAGHRPAAHQLRRARRGRGRRGGDGPPPRSTISGCCRPAPTSPARSWSSPTPTATSTCWTTRSPASLEAATTSCSSTARRRSACSPSTRWSRRARCSSRCRPSTTLSRASPSCSRRSRLVQEHLNPELAILGVVVTMYDGRTRLGREVAGEVRENLGASTSSTRSSRATCASARRPATGCRSHAMMPTCAGSDAYFDLAKEVVSRD